MRVLTEHGRGKVRDAIEHALAVLTLLRRRQVAAFTREGARDPIGAIALVLLGVAVIVGLRLALTREPDGPALRFGLELGVTAASAAVLERGLVRPDTARLAAGPFHQLLVQAGVADRWSRGQINALVGFPAALVAATLLPDVGRSLTLAAAVACGLIVVAPHLSKAFSEGDARRAARRASSRRSLTGPLLVALVQARRRDGRGPAILVGAAILFLGAGVSRLALANNPDPGLATLLLAAAGLSCGGLIGALDVELLRFLGRTPTGLPQLLAASCMPAAGVTALAMVPMGVLIGLRPALALAAALAVFAGLAGATALTALHALRGRPRFARAATTVDLVLIGMAAAAFAPAAPVWFIVRAVLLWRAAEKGRWLSC